MHATTLLEKLFVLAALVQCVHSHLDHRAVAHVVGTNGELQASATSTTASKPSVVGGDDNSVPNLRRSTLETTPPANFVDIQRKWHNWYGCTDGNRNGTSTVSEPRQYFTPPNYHFMEYALTCNTTEKKGTISTGNQTLVFAIHTDRFINWSNDHVAKKCGLNTSEETEKLRFETAAVNSAAITTPTFRSKLFSKVDGKDIGFFYIYDNGTFFLEDCPGKEICGPDTCDEPPNGPCKGIDAFPLMGWYATDTRTWSNGETHIYEMGNAETNVSVCSNTRYVVTAVGPPTKAPTKAPTKSPTKAPTKAPTKTPTKAPTKKPCGLFGWSIFCPLTRCGVLGRLLKLCK